MTRPVPPIGERSQALREGRMRVRSARDDERGPCMVVARRGDYITCPDGHRVYRAVRDIPVREMVAHTSVVRCDNGEHPPKREPAPPCPECGANLFPYLGNNRWAVFINGKLFGDDR